MVLTEEELRSLVDVNHRSPHQLLGMHPTFHPISFLMPISKPLLNCLHHGIDRRGITEFGRRQSPFPASAAWYASHVSPHFFSNADFETSAKLPPSWY